MTEDSVAALAGALGDDLRRDGRLVDRVVAAAREHLGMDVGFLAEFRDHEEVFVEVEGAGASFGFAAGEARPIETTYCGRMVAGALPNVVADARSDPRVGHLAITRDADIGAYVGVPVRLSSGRLYGTLCCLSHQPEPDLRQRDVRFMEVLARVLGEEIAVEQAELDRRRDLVEQVHRVLAGERLSVVFQPIVRLSDRRLVGVEALSRFDAEPVRRPDEWFAAAWEVGLGTELELAAVRRALAHLHRLPEDVYLSINASPAALVGGAFAQLLDGVDGRRVLVEVTEHSLVNEFDSLCAARARVREHGVRLAVDDAGAGYSGLNRMVALAPDVIKLDRFLTAGIDGDPARQALAAAAATLAGDRGPAIIAEGIETEAALQALRAVGIQYGQGYHLGRPGALPAGGPPDR